MMFCHLYLEILQVADVFSVYVCMFIQFKERAKEIPDHKISSDSLGAHRLLLITILCCTRKHCCVNVRHDDPS
ncbi:hypothetical protein XENTR_v10000258 [Xenopus tropicalis]|nr:hypothetical protein XENTR_v10000258 [Xenopus tropicalis]